MSISVEYLVVAGGGGSGDSAKINRYMIKTLLRNTEILQ